MEIVKKPKVSVVHFAEAGNQLSVLLPNRQSLNYSLLGSVEYIPPGRGSTEDGLKITNAYGIARLKESTESDAPAAIGFGLAKPVRGSLTGRGTSTVLQLRWQGLITQKQYRIIGPAHPTSYRPALANLRLQILYDPRSGGLVIAGVGTVAIPEIGSALLPATLMLCCGGPPDKGKCKKLCLDIKVGPRAGGGPVMTKDQVKAVIKRVNEIWGCTVPGQCCIEFTVSDDDIHLTPNGLKSKVKVKTGDPTDEHKAAVNVDRSKTCYNVYYVETMEPPAGDSKSYPGMTLRDDNASVMVQDPPNSGYTNETLATLTAHELGHALDLAWDPKGTDDDGVDKHSNKKKNVMYKNADLGTQLNDKQCTKARQSSRLKDDEDRDCTSKPLEPKTA
jgi:hypothetical protein